MSNSYYNNVADVLAQDIAELIDQRRLMATRDMGQRRSSRARRQWREELREATSQYRDWEEVCDITDASRALEARLSTRADTASANGSTLVDDGLAPVLAWTAVTSALHTAVGPNGASATVQTSPTTSRFNWAVSAAGKTVASGSHRSVVGAKRLAERAVAAHRPTRAGFTPLYGNRPAGS